MGLLDYDRLIQDKHADQALAFEEAMEAAVIEGKGYFGIVRSSIGLAAVMGKFGELRSDVRSSTVGHEPMIKPGLQVVQLARIARNEGVAQFRLGQQCIRFNRRQVLQDRAEYSVSRSFEGIYEFIDNNLNPEGIRTKCTDELAFSADELLASVDVAARMTFARSLPLLNVPDRNILDARDDAMRSVRALHDVCWKIDGFNPLTDYEGNIWNTAALVARIIDDSDMEEISQKGHELLLERLSGQPDQQDRAQTRREARDTRSKLAIRAITHARL